MREYEQRHDPGRLIAKRLLSVVLFGFLLFTLGGVWEMARKEREVRAKRDIAERELGVLESRAADLRAEVVRLRTPEGVEAELRRQFELGKEGEGLIVIVEDLEPRMPTSTEGKSWWKSLFPFLIRE